MPAQKTVASSPVGGNAYQVQDAHGGRTIVQNSATTGAISIGQVTGGQTHLTRQNVIDLLPALTAFANTGVLP